MAKKTTTRDRQCKKISKQRANRQRMRLVARRVGLVCSLLCVVLGGTAVWSVWHSGRLAKWQQQAVDGAWQLTADAGFRLKTVEVSGLKKVEVRAVQRAAGVAPGDPVLALSLPEMKERIEKIPHVRSVQISRRLPDRLALRVEERRPAAIWQYQGRMQMIDAEGVILGKADLKSPEAAGLPLLVGQMEARQVKEFFGFLQKAPDLAAEMKSASLIRERRWDIALKQGMQIRLPEGDLTAAWERLEALKEQKALTRQDIKVIDLRVPDRLFIRQQQPIVSEKGAQDT